MSGLPTIYQTFSGKHVFVTGGSGFLGKVLLYKLLKEFGDVGSITLLMRGKKGKQPLERLESDVFSSACYDGIKKDLGPEEWKRRSGKVRVATGDVTIDQLGLNQVDQNFLAENCSIIIHLAATVNFQEKLHLSVQMNVLGTLRVLALARKCVNLEAFIHTSTCYVNYTRHGKNLVKEQVYPLPFDPEQMCRLILGLHEEEVPRTSAFLLKKYGFPNTYTFTKNMAESLLLKMKGTLPVTIVRPSIVGCSLREPYPGWVDVLTAAGGILLTTAIGLAHEFHCGADLIADIVPVDYVVNTLIKAAYKTSIQHKFGTLKLSPVVDVANSSATGGAANVSGSANTSSALVEKNLRRVDAATKGGAVLISGNSSRIPSTEATIESLRISTAAESTSGMIRTNHGNAKNSLKQVLNSNNNNNNAGGDNNNNDGAASSGSSDSNGTAATLSNARLPFVFQSATSSSLTPLTWDNMQSIVCAYFIKYPCPRTVDRPYLNFYLNRTQFEIVYFLRRKVPYYALSAASKIPGLMTEKQTKTLALYARALNRVSDLHFQFRPFVTIDWRYDAKNSDRYLDLGLDAKTRAAFGTDLYDIDWKVYIESYSYGIVRYFMKVKDNRPVVTVPGSSSEKFLKSML